MAELWRDAPTPRARRELRLRAAGYLVLRYTWAQVTVFSALVAADLRAALAS